MAPTTTGSFSAIFHPTIDIDGIATTVLVEQTTAVDPGRLGALVGRLAADELTVIDRALCIVLRYTTSQRSARRPASWGVQ